MPGKYIGVFQERGHVVPADEALDYAMERCGIRFADPPRNPKDREEFKDALVEWFFSDAWERHDGAEDGGEADSWAS